MAIEEFGDIDTFCMHCGARNRLTFVDGLDSYRFDCSRCGRIIGFIDMYVCTADGASFSGTAASVAAK